MAMPPATIRGRTQITAAAQPTASPIPASRGQPRPARQSLFADWMLLAIEEDTKSRIAQHQQKQEHALFKQRHPRVVRQPSGAAMRH